MVNSYRRKANRLVIKAAYSVPVERRWAPYLLKYVPSYFKLLGEEAKEVGGGGVQ